MGTGRRDSCPARPRVLFLSSTTYDLPLPPSLAKGWEAVTARLEVRILARRGRVEAEDPRFRLIRARSGRLSGPAFHPLLIPALRRELRTFAPDIISAQGPFEAIAFLLATRLPGTPRPKLLIQLHGDWRAAARFYGSAGRRLLSPLADRAAAATLRRADGTRAVGPFTARLIEEATGRPPLAVYPTYFDLEAFRQAPPQPFPARPSLAWVGALERVKNVDGFVAAWHQVSERVPDARLAMVGDGRQRPIVDELVRRDPERVTAIRRLDPSGVAKLLDESTALALPSLSEGTPRVIMEAFARGRPVVASRVGGIPDLVVPGENGLLVPPDDPDALADALTRVLGDRPLAEQLGGAAYQASQALDWSADRLADELLALVRRVVGGNRDPG